VAMARRTHADVLIPKMVAHGRRVPRSIFRHNIDRAVLAQDPVFSSLTPHKLVRRGFLDEHKLRFPEGRRRLEDHIFVVEVFLKADVISVLADYPCYHRVRRHDESNAAFQKWDADYYFGFVGEVIDLITANTEPGEYRNVLITRTYTAEMLPKLTGRRLRHWDLTTRREIFAAVRDLAVERFPPGFHDRLPIVQRATGQAIVDNRLDQLTELADRTASTTPRAVLQDLSWSERGWTARIEAELLNEDGSPILVTPTADGDWTLDPRVVPPALAPTSYSLEEIKRAPTDVLLRHESNHVEWYVKGRIPSMLVAVPDDPNNAHRLICRATVSIDPETVAGGRPLAAGRWDLQLRMSSFGISRVAALQADSDMLSSPGVFLAAQRIIKPTRAGREKSLAFTVAMLTPDRHARVSSAIHNVRDVVQAPNGSIAGTIDGAGSRAGRSGEWRVILTDSQATRAKHRANVQPAAATQALIAYVASMQPYRPKPSSRPEITPAAPTIRLGIADRLELHRQLRRVRRRLRRFHRQVMRTT
jgi:hypothetical protein